MINKIRTNLPKYGFVGLWLLTFVILSILPLIIFYTNTHKYSFLIVSYMLLVNIPITHRIVEVLFAIFGDRYKLPKLDNLSSKPSVALLYCTCDDVVIECLENLKKQTYLKTDIFVLDDSQLSLYREILNETNFKVIRRGTRKGYKAGNLNHWLNELGDRYDYFVIVDADSRLPENFVERMLRYAEHSENKNVAFFESHIFPYDLNNIFTRLVTVQTKIHLYIAERLNNRLGIMLSAGHNNLCRTHDIIAVGGFDERFVSEDHATTLNLATIGKECKLVNVSSFEGVPSTLHSFIKRSARWARSDIQLLAHDWKNTTLIQQIDLFVRAFSSMLSLPFLLFMLYVTWGFKSSWPELVRFLEFLFLDKGYLHPKIWPSLVIFGIYLYYLMFATLPIVFMTKTPLSQYFSSLVTGFSLGLATTPYIVFEMGKILLHFPFVFHPTLKKCEETNFFDYLRAILPAVILGCVVIGGVIHNPISIILNWTWIIPLVLSPIVLLNPEDYSSQG